MGEMGVWEVHLCELRRIAHDRIAQQVAQAQVSRGHRQLLDNVQHRMHGRGGGAVARLTARETAAGAESEPAT